jgi:aurora kinase
MSILSTRHPSIYTPVEKKISIKDFKIGKCLGNGRFGKVYQAIEKNTGFLVALKKISKETIKSNKLEDQFAL